MVEEGQAKQTAPTHYVAVGASAGGLEAIEALFGSMPADTGLGFVVVQHLSPDYKSLMVELLSKKTPMPVRRAEDGTEVEANHIYLIPPKKNLTIFHGRLMLSEQDHTKGINLPIDVFLRSLAEDKGEKAVAIILSGTGSDGMRGVRAVKEQGGMIMVQDEASARFDGMPKAAVSTGLVDFVLSPDKMAAQLQAYVRHPYVTKSERPEALLGDEDGLGKLFSILRETSKVDFTYYKPTTITRRIERRMTINQVDTIQDYVSLVKAHPGEAQALYRELLIGVTSFFRDQGAFDALAERWLPELLETSQGSELRLWVAGCSTGEEAYSLAITLQEALAARGAARDVRIFATDIDQDAIHYAANGVYPESIAADLPPRILSKYFHRKDDRFHVSRSIREMVVFAPQNLIKDPPFTNIHLISCRNLLIYLQPVLQRKVLDYFAFSLNAGGLLVLGTSETAGEMGESFEPVDSKWRIYRSRGRGRALGDPVHLMSATDTRTRDLAGRMAALRRTAKRGEEERIGERLLESVVREFATLAVVVTEQMEAAHVFGEAAGLLRVPSGKQVNNIEKMAVKDLAVPLSAGVHKAFREWREVQFSNVRVRGEGGTRVMNVYVKPLTAKSALDRLVLVVMSEAREAAQAETGQARPVYDLSKEAEDRMHDLEQELQLTRENLQATIEELETANEELQATNEELLASNEELQSTNEELQSTNEELCTVNAEYQGKIIELTELHNDVDNLLSATQVGKLILDENYEVRRYSPQVTHIFALTPGDLGRPIGQIPHFLAGCEPMAVIRNVEKDGELAELEVRTQDGHWYLMRVVPYAIGPQAFSGTVLSFIEIDRVKEAQMELAESRALLEEASKLAQVGSWQYTPKSGQVRWSEETARILGVGREEEASLEDLVGSVAVEQREEMLTALGRAAREGVNFDLGLEVVTKRGEKRHVRALGKAVEEGGKVVRVAGALLDTTERVEAERALREAQKLFETVTNTSPALVWMAGVDKGCQWFNRRWLEFTGRTLEQERGYGWAEGVHGDDLAVCLKVYGEAFEERKAFRMEYRLRRRDGEYRWLLDEGHPRYDSKGRFEGYLGACLDVTEPKQAEEARRTAERTAQAILDSVNERVALVEAGGEVVMANREWGGEVEMVGLEPGRVKVGANLLEMWREAGAGGNEEAARMAQGLEEVMGGRQEEYEIERVVGRGRKRVRMLARVTPLHGTGGSPRAVVVTLERLAGAARGVGA